MINNGSGEGIKSTKDGSAKALMPEQEKSLQTLLTGGADEENDGILGHLKKMNILPDGLDLKNDDMQKIFRKLLRVLLEMLGPLGKALMPLFDDDKSAMNNLSALSNITGDVARTHGASSDLRRHVVDALRDKVETGQLKFTSDGDKSFFLNEIEGLVEGFDYNHLNRFNREVNKILSKVEGEKFIEFVDYIPANENISYGSAVKIDKNMAGLFDNTIPIMGMDKNGALQFKNQDLTLKDLPEYSTFQFVFDSEGSVTNGMIKTPAGGTYYIGIQSKEENQIDGFNLHNLNDEKLTETLLAPEEIDMAMNSGLGMKRAPNTAATPNMSIK